MWISDTSIKRPVFATMVIMSFMVLGIVSMTRLGIDLFPEVNFPFVNVTVVYPGAGARRSRDARHAADRGRGRRHQRRQARRSRPRPKACARVGVELRLEVDPQAATAEVREKVAAIRGRCREQIEDPTIQRFDVAALPIMMFAVGSSAAVATSRAGRSKTTSSRCSSRSTASRPSRSTAARSARSRSISIRAGSKRSSLPLSEVAAKLAAENLDVPGGQVKRDGQASRCAPRASSRRLDEIENVILRSDGGSTVRVKDVGDGRRRLRGPDVDDAPERRRRRVVLGPQAVGRQHGRDRRPRRRDARHGARPSFPAAADPPGPQRRRRSSRRTSRDVRRHIIFGGLMAVLIIFVFMRDWRSTLISALALPTSVIATFFFM